MLGVLKTLGVGAKTTARVAESATSAARVTASEVASAANAARSGARAAEVAAGAREITQVAPVRATRTIAENADRLGSGAAKITVGAATGYGIVKGVNRMDQWASELPQAIEHTGHDLSVALGDTAAEFGRELHKLEEGVASTIGMPVSRALQVVVFVGTIAGASYIVYRIIR